jgi:hypothetical protein
MSGVLPCWDGKAAHPWAASFLFAARPLARDAHRESSELALGPPRVHATPMDVAPVPVELNARTPPALGALALAVDGIANNRPLKCPLVLQTIRFCHQHLNYHRSTLSCFGDFLELGLNNIDRKYGRTATRFRLKTSGFGTDISAAKPPEGLRQPMRRASKLHRRPLSHQRSRKMTIADGNGAADDAEPK